MTSKTIITYLINWNPSWIKTVEFSNRLIKWLSIPRKDFKDALDRNELKNSWVYILIWIDENENEKAYIGQATVLWKRLNEHYKDEKKDFWNNAICFTYKDWSLTESDINYIEKQLINKAKKINRYSIANWNSWNNWLIQEYRIPDMQEFIQDLEILIVNLWYPIFKEIVPKNQKDKKNIYYLKNRWSNAELAYTEEWFIVLKNSSWPKELVKSEIEKKWYSYKNRQILLSKWIIKEDWDNIYFLKDYIFKSPSSASSLIMWSRTNWWILWKDKKWNTLDYNIRK